MAPEQTARVSAELHTVDNDPELREMVERRRREQLEQVERGAIESRERGDQARRLRDVSGATRKVDEEREKQAPQLLSLTWAADLAIEPTYDPQLVPGLFERTGKALIFGASSSGKTTFANDIGCRIAAGLPWNGRAVLRGLVVIVAAESPEGTLRRIRAFIRHNEIDPFDMHLAVYEAPLTFEIGAIDRLIETIRAHCAAHTAPVRMVVIDTLAANEAGKEDSEHFGRVDRAQARIRDELNCLAVVIHHSGKIAEAGARGHSSLFAGMDTVIEVTGTEGLRCATIVKQRDGASGEGIAFSLNPIGIGFREIPDSTFPETVTACVVEYQGAPRKTLRPPRDGHQTRALDALRLDHRDNGTPRWTFKEAADVFRRHHAAVGEDSKDLHRNIPRKTFKALAKTGHLLIDGGFITLQDA